VSPTNPERKPQTVSHIDVRCGGCGYGIVALRLPDVCPMCHAAEGTWTRSKVPRFGNSAKWETIRDDENYDREVAADG
jgi:hypothetical protein